MPREAERYQWVDAAKGACMVLVVLLHVAGLVDVLAPGHGQNPWYVLSDYLRPLRMPLFFLVSGFLAVAALSRPLSAVRSRTIGLWYLYLLWSVLLMARLWVPLSGEEPPAFREALLGLVAGTAYWYLYALPLYFLICRGAARLLGNRVRWAWVPFAALSLASPLLQGVGDSAVGPVMDPPVFDSLAANLVWFFAGTQAGTIWPRLLEGATRAKAVAAAVGYAAACGVAAELGILTAARPALSLIALYAAAQVLGTVRMDSLAFRGLRHVGAQTLPVYVLHIFAVAAVSATARVVHLDGQPALASWWAGLTIAPVLTAAVVAATYFAGRAILASPLRWSLTPWPRTSSREPRTISP